MASEKGGDIEAGSGDAAATAAALYPKMSESPKLWWTFIRKVCATILIQLLITATVAAVIALVRYIPHFFVSSTPAAWGVCILILFFPLILLWPLIRMRERQPINLMLTWLHPVCIGVLVGVAAAFSGKETVLEATGLTMTVVVCLTRYTFWAAGRVHDFKFIGAFLFASLLMLTRMRHHPDCASTGKAIKNTIGMPVCNNLLLHDHL